MISFAFVNLSILKSRPVEILIELHGHNDKLFCTMLLCGESFKSFGMLIHKGTNYRANICIRITGKG